MSDSTLVAVVVGSLTWVAYFGSFGWYAASHRGRTPIEGAVMGILGGPMGVLLAAVLPAEAPASEQPQAVPPPVPRTPRKLLGEVPDGLPLRPAR